MDTTIAAHAYSSIPILDIAMYFVFAAGGAAIWFGITEQKRESR